MTLKIADLVLPIRSAGLSCWVDRPGVLHWGFEVLAEETTVDGGSVWEPHIQAEVLFATRSTRRRSWVDLVPRTISWGDVRGDADPKALVYVFEHIPLYDAALRFESASTGLDFAWSGKCDLDWKPGYECGVAVQASGHAVFEGVLCGRESEDVCRSAIGDLLAQGDLVYLQDDNGVARLVPPGRAGR